MEKDINILILDDNQSMLETLKDILGTEGYNVVTADSLEAARKDISQKFYHLVLVDLKLQEGSGLDLLRAAKKANRDTMVIIFTAFASL